MSYIMRDKTFISKLKYVCNNTKTLYVMGGFGAPMTSQNKKYYTSNHSYNKKAERTKMIMAADDNTFGFDCVNLIKGVLWGWTGDKTKTYGGAVYASNGVPDINADTFITKCTDVSNTNWDKIVPGEAVWMKGHIGVYIGDGLVIESTPSWKNQVQTTCLGNIGTVSGYPTRKWTKHGKIPWVKYTKKEEIENEEIYTVVKQDSDKCSKFKTACSLNLRLDPLVGSPVICVMPGGSLFISDGCSSVDGSITWVHGYYKGKDGKTYGWASKKYLKSI